MPLNVIGRWMYIALIVIVLFPWDILTGYNPVTPASALFVGLMFALCFGCPFPKFNKKSSKYLLQASVVGLGFGMNVVESLKSGSEGMLFTIVSVVSVMVLGCMFGYWMHINRKTAYLISSGTAICGGSAIAAVGPVLHADEKEMAVSLGVIFILNAIALFIFPPIGHFFEMSQQQFGTWAAIAIHDTSSVVGAGDAYGPEALRIATLIKLTRALWIIPLAFVTMLIFRDKKARISIPWFIFLFVIAMVVNTYCGIPAEVSEWLVWLAKKGLVLTLFFIGASLSINTIKSVGTLPLLLAIALWIFIAVSSFMVVVFTIE
ncbi:YeiH family protein [Muribaculum intestinale]|uniref:YeiH family protein n=2 Tax=Muribaculum intestinale TaxID=1796646 RepID=UPI000F49AC32|nr:putative sulfate exporter family transporter [Muribaculum intestinale]ROT03822.1 putative sulfate exporter family transporter [Muribaculaceae bacterium Isolate-100 (HZI)]RXE64161.1 putative sulfate exporter family transporter [Muribaculaceae bacterium Isolate-007 (NCI)]TGX80618.1 putative sulfate exporter family transporter [Muribaculum intestinale]